MEDLIWNFCNQPRIKMKDLNSTFLRSWIPNGGCGSSKTWMADLDFKWRIWKRRKMINMELELNDSTGEPDVSFGKRGPDDVPER